MNAKELKQLIGDQAFRLKKAETRGMMVNQERETLRNLLSNRIDDIMDVIEFAIGAQETIDRLTIEVESADAELNDKDEEIAELRKELDGAGGKKKQRKAADGES